MTARSVVVLHRTKCWLRQTETWINQQLRSLPERIESHVVCDRTDNLDQFPLERLHSLAALPSWSRRLLGLARKARIASANHTALVARKVGAQLLHSHFGNEAWRALPSVRSAGLRHVVTFYGYDVTRVPEQDPIWRARYAELFESADRVLCEGPHMRQALVRLGCPEQAAHVHHLGVDLERIPFFPRSWRPGQTLDVLVAGSFREKKGIPYAMLALGELARARPALKLQVTVIGDASDSSEQQLEKRRILDAVRHAELGESVRFMGYQPYSVLLEQARSCHVFLSPSVKAGDGDTEGGAPVSIIEMAASGMVVVSTQHCDIPNVLRGPAAEFLAPERDPAALAGHLVRLVDGSNQWLSLQQFVRAELEQRFDAAKQGGALADHYDQVAALTRKPVSPMLLLMRPVRRSAIRVTAPE